MQVLTANVCVCKILHLVPHCLFFCDLIIFLVSCIGRVFVYHIHTEWAKKVIILF